DNKQEEVDPNALEREVESDEEDESADDEEEFEEDDEDDAELDISYGTWRTEWEGFHLRRPRAASPSTPVIPTTGTASPSMPVVPATGTASPTTPVASPFPSQPPPVADEEGPQLTERQLCWISGSCTKLMCKCRGEIDPGSASRYITMLVHAHIPGPRRYAFTRPEDLPQARVIWESTTETNLRKSMWEVRDKAMKTTGSQDPTTWLYYDPVVKVKLNDGTCSPSVEYT
ncbi:hypothetical protein Taro_031704, partial [Colocasia esculenta]|nr:hypothetical protein [Colocasia esculenta]